jgi:hypothetical protein
MHVSLCLSLSLSLTHNTPEKYNHVEFRSVHVGFIACFRCGAGITGEKHVQEHAVATGHTNFAEYNKDP